MPWSDPTPSRGAGSRDRDAATLLGWFHLALAAPVLAGVVFADLSIDRVLNALAALALAAVGAFFLWLGRRAGRRIAAPPSDAP
jgi:hypothetical protein